mmetsp:Transcript_21977/g.69494  ORF Transcript_21977/g.69494 Transcript_21977/m.69494 type:complete len:275 (+) Transcript_21977:367-1191(+)
MRPGRCPSCTQVSNWSQTPPPSPSSGQHRRAKTRHPRKSMPPGTLLIRVRQNCSWCGFCGQVSHCWLASSPSTVKGTASASVPRASDKLACDTICPMRPGKCTKVSSDTCATYSKSGRCNMSHSSALAARRAPEPGARPTRRWASGPAGVKGSESGPLRTTTSPNRRDSWIMSASATPVPSGLPMKKSCSTSCCCWARCGQHAAYARRICSRAPAFRQELATAICSRTPAAPRAPKGRSQTATIASSGSRWRPAMRPQGTMRIAGAVAGILELG